MRPIKDKNKLLSKTTSKHKKTTQNEPVIATKGISKRITKNIDKTLEPYIDIEPIQDDKALTPYIKQEIEDKNEDTNKISRLAPYRIRLNTITNTRKTLSNLVKANARGLVSCEQMRTTGYGLQVLIHAFSVEAELKIQDDIKALRREIRNMNNLEDRTENNNEEESNNED